MDTPLNNFLNGKKATDQPTPSTPKNRPTAETEKSVVSPEIAVPLSTLENLENVDTDKLLEIARLNAATAKAKAEAEAAKAPIIPKSDKITLTIFGVCLIGGVIIGILILINGIDINLNLLG